jgi:hypothetical protein
MDTSPMAAQIDPGLVTTAAVGAHCRPSVRHWVPVNRGGWFLWPPGPGHLLVDVGVPNRS